MPYEGIDVEKFTKVITTPKIQKYEGSCWAASLSVLLRLNGVNESEEAIAKMYAEWVHEGITFKQLESLVEFYNKFYFKKETSLVVKTREMKCVGKLKGIMPYIGQYKGVMVFIEGHYVVVLGRNDDNDLLSYYDPWSGVVEWMSEALFYTSGTQESVVVQEE